MINECGTPLTFLELAGTLIEEDAAVPHNNMPHSVKGLPPLIHFSLKCRFLSGGVCEPEGLALIRHNLSRRVESNRHFA